MEAGSVANGSTPTSADACMSIVHSLSCHRQGGKSFICLQFRISKKARKIGRNLPLDLMSTYLVSIKVEISTNSQVASRYIKQAGYIKEAGWKLHCFFF